MSELRQNKPKLPKELRILCFGDSLTAGYTMGGLVLSPYAPHLQASLEHSLSSSYIDVEVAGRSGDQVQGQFLYRIKAQCEADEEQHYDWVIVMGGTNDLGWGQQPETIYDGLKEVWKVALDTGASVLALTVIETAGSSSRMIQKRNELNASIMNHEADRFYAFDLCSEIPYASLNDAKRDQLWDDGVHLTAEGYKMMGDAIAVRLLEILHDLEEPGNAENAFNP